MEVCGQRPAQCVMGLREYESAICGALDPVAISPARNQSKLLASLEAENLGGLVIAKAAASEALYTCRSPVSRKPEDRYYLLQLQTQGRTRIQHRGAVIDCLPGTLLIMDSVHQVDGEQFENSEVVLMRLPEVIAKSEIPWIESFCAVPIKNSGFSQRLFVNLIYDIWQQRNFLTSTDIFALPGNILHVLKSTLECFTEQDGKRFFDHADIRFLKILHYIAENFRNSDLNIDTVANHLNMSRRTVTSIAQKNGTTVSRLIMEKRLEESLKLISSPMSKKLSITEIAYANGFLDLSHFSKSFKEHFGYSPVNFRRLN
ncbi:MAG: AraC family transcriptional regulator [Novosphingobium sp.]